MGLALAGCDDDDGAGSCSDDTACNRGEICASGSCTVLPCISLGECPGTGRTCLSDLEQCSAKECNAQIDGIAVNCEGGRTCVESGGYRFSCVDESSLECDECSTLGIDCPNCTDQDQGMLPVDIDAGPDSGLPGDAGGPEPDASAPGEAHLCSSCTVNSDCDSLGAGAECTAITDGTYCSSACTPGGDECPEGFTCLAPFNQCLPATVTCGGCLAEPCTNAGEVCDFASGECIQPREACGPCTTDSGCQDGLSCTLVGASKHCLAPCADGCAAGSTCDMADGLCKPDSGQCDACGGACAGPTPVCLDAQARCVECGPGAPCEAPEVCSANNTCQENMQIGCINDAECIAQGLAVCFGGECVQCLQASDCPPRHECSAQQICEASPCSGVTCQAGSQCDAQLGRCGPGCQVAADCAQPDLMGCNAATGQCYFNDASCDEGAAEGVCSPGSICSSPLPGIFPPSCSCRKVDPSQPGSPDLIPCHPGFTCFQLEWPPESGVYPDGSCVVGF